MARRVTVTVFWAYTATVVMVTVAFLFVFAVRNQRIGENRERGKIVHSLLMEEMLEHTDSIAEAIMLQTAFVFLYERDSLIRARSAECGPLVVC